MMTGFYTLSNHQPRFETAGADDGRRREMCVEIGSVGRNRHDDIQPRHARVALVRNCEDSKTAPETLDLYSPPRGRLQHHAEVHAVDSGRTHNVLRKRNPFRLPGRHSEDREPPSPRACVPCGGELFKCCSFPSALWGPTEDVAARLQWMDQMEREQATRLAEKELPLSTAQGQGLGPTMVRDHGLWQSQQVGSHWNQAPTMGPSKPLRRVLPWPKVWDRWAE
jgi:hypothetical protein